MREGPGLRVHSPEVRSLLPGHIASQMSQSTRPEPGLQVPYNPLPGNRPIIVPGLVCAHKSSFLLQPSKIALTTAVSCSPGSRGLLSSELCWGPKETIDSMMRLVNRLESVTPPLVNSTEFGSAGFSCSLQLHNLREV